jgi:hypothetical protein
MPQGFDSLLGRISTYLTGLKRPELVVDREALNLSQPRKDWYAEDTSGTKWPIF